MAKCANEVLSPSTSAISLGPSTAAPRHRCQPINSMGSPLCITIRAASGSTQMLYSAAGVTLPSQQGLPPITTQRLTLAAMDGSLDTANATLVSGPSVTRTSPGLASTVSMMASTACRASVVCRGTG